MENKKITIPVIIILVIAVVSLGIAFATFSTVLNINGSADVAATSWDIFFTTEDDGAKPTQETTVPIANISNAGTSASSNSATIVATTFTWNANFQKPGDKIIYTIYVKNGGSYNAQVSNIVKPAITCTNDSKNACSHLSYNLYTDNAGNTPLTTSFTVAAGETEVFYLIATLDSSYGGNDGSGLVTADITSNSTTATVTFEQTSSAVTNSGNGGNSGGNGEGNEQQSSVQYFFNDSWVDSLSEVAGDNYIPTTYIKKQNDAISICLNINSTEYCFDESDLDNSVSAVTSSCSSLGLDYFTPDYGSGTSVGVYCSNYESDTAANNRITVLGLRDIYSPSGDITDEEPFSSRGIEIDINRNDDTETCSISGDYSEESSEYELSFYYCSYPNSNSNSNSD